jgi:hypothetical protein
MTRALAIAVLALLSLLLIFPSQAGEARPANRRPVARAGTQQEVLKGSRVQLDGSRSYDPEGDPLSFKWEMVSRPEGSAAALDDPGSPKPGFIADMEGAYRVRLVVSDGKVDSRPSDVDVKAVYGRLSNPISPDDFEPLASYGKSYLAQNSAGKKLLYVEGSGYERGYATGKLCPKSVYRMTHDFVQNLIREFLREAGIDLDPSSFGVVWTIIWKILQVAVAANQDAIPPEYIQEMQGMADACREEGYDVSFNDIITLNVGNDSLESITMSIGSLFLCNEFAVFDKATVDGRLYHGRDFMFFTGGDVFSEEALLIVHNPDSGYPFVASAAPGFVGIPTGLNSRGVSCAMDVVPSILTRPIIVGEGCLLLCRKAVQYGGSLEEAVSLIRDSDRAVPWLYMVADGKQKDAAVMETIASSVLPEGEGTYDFFNRLWLGILGIFFPWLNQPAGAVEGGVRDEGGRSVTGRGDLREELSGLAPGGALPVMEKGVMIREADYVDPEWLNGLQYWVDPGDGSNPLLEFFPTQIETYPDLVAMTNHYIIPWTAITYPSTGRRKQDSMWRYKTMLGLLSEGYGKVDRKRAMWIIDFLNPARCDYYGNDTSQSVKGHHVLMDNASGDMWSLHGYYNGPWEHVNLNDVLSR